MNLDEAKHLARSWTSGIDTQLDGWRSAMKLLIDHIDELEREGNTDFKMPLQPQLRTIADIIRQTEERAK
jgi:hypothetical protein